MKNPKVISAIFTLILWLILAWWYVNAMTYDISWDYTQITIPTNYSSWIIINRWEENSENSAPQSVTSCEESPSSDEIDESVYKCEHTYTASGHYEIRIENHNETTPSKISLDSWNVTNIKNFSGFENLTEIYLRNNNLDTIPSIIWENRNQIKTIKLSNTVSYNNESWTKYIDLSNNPINFLWITKIGNYNLTLYPVTSYPNFHNTTEYNFEWFGFSNNNNLTYDYGITNNPDNSSWIFIETWITNTWTSINSHLNSWTYYFNICIHETNICEWTYFTVDYDESVYFTGSLHPTSWEILTSIENIQFQRERSWDIPSEFISWYSYTLTKNNNKIIEDTTPNSTYTLDPNIIADNPNGNYSFSVNLVNTDGTIIATDKIEFTVLIPSTISINLPNEKEPSSTVQFSRDYYLPSPYLFTGYEYTLLKWNNVIESRTIDSINSTWFKLYYLENGDYTFTITMKYLSNWAIKTTTDVKSFTINKKSDSNWWSNWWTNQWSSSKNNTTNNIITQKINTWNIQILETDYTTDTTETIDTKDEIYIARNCKQYTIKYYETLKVFSSPDLKTNEYFINKEYFKRYIDSKNPYKSWCPSNVWWITTYYNDKSNDNTKYIAPNWKVYFIIWEAWNYYSNELNKELRTPTNFKTIQQLKYYIRDRNPLISMWNIIGNGNFINKLATNPTTITTQRSNTLVKDNSNEIKTTNSATQEFDKLFNQIWDKSWSEKDSNLSYISSNSIKIEREDWTEWSLFTFDNPNIGLKKINIIRRDTNDERFILSKRDDWNFELDLNENGETTKLESISEKTIIEDILPVFRKYLNN